MNTTILMPNMTSLPIGSVNYVESICSKYVTDLSLYLFYIALFNLIYFIIIRRILNIIPDINIKIAKININNIFENIIILSNVFICGYYIIFNYNSFVIDNLKMIWFITKIILTTSILIIIYFNRNYIISLYNILYNEAKKNNEEKQNDNTPKKEE